jgi:hypothetical protein
VVSAALFCVMETHVKYDKSAINARLSSSHMCDLSWCGRVGGERVEAVGPQLRP